MSHSAPAVGDPYGDVLDRSPGYVGHLSDNYALPSLGSGLGREAQDAHSGQNKCKI